MEEVSQTIAGPSILCDSSPGRSISFRLSPGKNGRSHFVSSMLGNKFYSISGDFIAVSMPIAQKYFNIESQDDKIEGKAIITAKDNNEIVTCDDFKYFMIYHCEREEYLNSRIDQNYWSLASRLERFSTIMPGFSFGSSYNSMAHANYDFSNYDANYDFSQFNSDHHMYSYQSYLKHKNRLLQKQNNGIVDDFSENYYYYY